MMLRWTSGLEAFHENWKDPLKDEFLLPVLADDMLKRGIAFDVLYSDDRWFGVTYKEDKPSVEASFRELLTAGEYREDLYSDL